jgi:hypothetical protein
MFKKANDQQFFFEKIIKKIKKFSPDIFCGGGAAAGAGAT